MILMKTLSVFLHKKQCYEVDAVQGENGRGLVLRLYEEAGEWMPPARTKVHIRFRKSDGTGGVYDTTPDGLSAWRIENNRVYVELVPQVLAVPGLVQLQVVLTKGSEELSTFTIHIHVEADPSLDTLGSVEYFNLSTRINDTVDAKLAHMEQSWQSLFNEITVTMFSMGGIDSTGAEVSSSTDIRSDMIVLGGRNMSVVFPEGVLVRCFYYDAQERFVGSSDTYGEPFTAFHSADYVRLVVCYEDEREITDLYALSDSISVSFPSDRLDAYRGNVLALGFGSFSDCMEDGYYAFEREDLAHISDAPALGCGGVLVVKAHGAGNRPIQTIHTADGQRWYWSDGAFRKSEDYLILGENLRHRAAVTEGYFISPSSGNPAVAPNSWYATVAIPAVSELTLGFGCHIYAFEASNTGGVSFWDKEMNNLGVLDVKDFKIGYTHNGYPCATIPVPEGAAYVRYTVRMWNANTGTVKWDASTTMLVAPGNAEDVKHPRIAEISGYSVLPEEKIPTKMSQLENDAGLFCIDNCQVFGRNLVGQGEITDGYFLSPGSGNPVVAAGSKYVTVPITDARLVTVCLGVSVYSFEASNVGAFSFLDDQKNLISCVDVADYKTIEDYNGFPCATIPVPDGAVYVRCTILLSGKWDATNTLSISCGSMEDLHQPRIVKIDGYPVCVSELEPAERKWAVIGDSLSAVNTTAAVKYHDYVAQELGLYVRNYASSGAGFTQGKTYSAQIAELDQEDCDVITIFTSGNDCDNDPPLGSVTDTGSDTLCGVINTTLDELFALKPYTSVGIITSCPWKWFMPSTPGNLMENYNNAIMEIARRRGIPVLDLYHSSNMRPDDEGFRVKFYNENGVQDNGVHPNSEGHKILAAPIREFVRSLLRP